MKELLVWADVETTGLDAQSEHLLEVAVILTDTDLKEIARFSKAVEFDSEKLSEIRENCIPFVRDMHSESDLWGRILRSEDTASLEDIDNRLSSLLGEHEDTRFYLAGNSVKLDFAFISANLPKTFKNLHYRVVDMSSLQMVFTWWGDVDEFTKELRHEALSDIEESIAQAKYLRGEVFGGVSSPPVVVNKQLTLF